MRKLQLGLAALAVLVFAGYATVRVLPEVQAQSTESSVAAAQVVQVFAIDNMTCALCPITVRKAMESVEGVASVDVDFDTKTATVVYDAAVATADAIADASTDAGYPAHPLGG